MKWLIGSLQVDVSVLRFLPQETHLIDSCITQYSPGFRS